MVDTDAVIYDEASLTPYIPTNPATKCKENHIVVYHFEAKAYGCVLKSVSQTWISEGLAEIHDLTKFILSKDKQKETKNQIFVINQEIKEIYDKNILEAVELKKKYDIMYQEANKLENQQQKELLAKFYEDDTMTKEELAIQIMEVRKNNEQYKEQILQDKLEALDFLTQKLHKQMQELSKSFEENPAIKIVWDSANEKFYATQR